jgi:hypothetical protein
MGMAIQVELPIPLPLSALMAFNPMLVALFLTYRADGMMGVKALLRQIFDFNRIPRKRWLWVIFLMMPILSTIQFFIVATIWEDVTDVQLPILVGIPMFILFFIAACGEELGWQGYAYERLAQGRSALITALILGVIWAVWHVIPYTQTSDTLTWVVWQCAVTVWLRVLIVWVYVNTGESLFSSIVFHTMINVSAFLFPNYGSYYDPFIATMVVMSGALVIIGLWGKTLKSNRINSEIQLTKW